MQAKSLFLLFALMAGQFPVASSAADAPPPGAIRQAVNRSIVLIQKSLTEYPRHNTCFSCHHQGVPSFALALARSHGFAVDEKALANVARQTAADLRGDLDNYRTGKGQPGGVTRAGYALLALKSAGIKGDEVSAAVTGFLLQRDKDKGFWNAGSNRPPSEASAFTNTTLGIRALNSFGTESDKVAIAARIDRARQWLEQTAPKDTEDRVFQLWGLQEAGATGGGVEKSAKALLAQQQADGGWAQFPGAASDAYATGSVLTVLRLTGQLGATDAAYQSGLGFLLRGQQADGSWHVVSRSKPFQPYFESGFPHGKDQFVSMAASAWATAALVLADAGPDSH